jgi:hypothetical protein
MNSLTNKALLSVIIGLAAVGVAGAATVNVGDPNSGRQEADKITVSTTWTADNVYDLRDQVYVMPGASLTIEPGTVVASSPIDPNGGEGGSLAVARGAKIYVMGTEDNPVIMTSAADRATWTGGDPKTGSWRMGANEWGNLTVMGDALISASHYDGSPVQGSDGVDNPKEPTGAADKQMEGLVAAGPTDTAVFYGGANDDDDSGEIHYLSIRYGGKVIGLANELNGLSLGAIGRETDIDHVEIMNNVDDGIEIWGGTMNIKYFSIWNIGDDSFDVDEGWRGKAQFGLIVQGYSLDAKQGSGVGDNCFETDGAEDSDAQPVTTSTIYNCTVIGQPLDGDGGTAWRDNARVQYRNCIWMDLGEYLIRPDMDDGDGANGYGYNGTLSWNDTWTTPAGTHSTVNIGSVDPNELYTVQQDGMLAEITDSIFFRNTYSKSYGHGTATAYDYVPSDPNDPDIDVADQLGVTVNGDDAPAKNNIVLDAGDPSPIAALGRDSVWTSSGQGKDMFRVIDLDPRARNAATSAASTAPADGFFTPADYRGAFSPDVNWLLGWTASDAYGFHAGQSNPTDPTASIELVQVESETTFDTVSGQSYVVETSTDGRNWTPVEVVEGDGTTKSVKDLDSFESGRLYRVRVQ